MIEILDEGLDRNQGPKFFVLPSRFRPLVIVVVVVVIRLSPPGCIRDLDLWRWLYNLQPPRE